MQSKQSRVMWIVVIALAFIFIVDPFHIFQGRRAPKVRISSDLRTELSEYMATAPTAPEAILNALSRADVVLIGETGYIKQHVEFMRDLIRPLYSAGIRRLGYQYALIDDQDALDDLVTASTFDEQLARQILFDNLAVFGWQEHVDLMRAVWEVNRSGASDDEPFRVIALSNRLDYAAIVEQDDFEDPEVMAKVLATGIPDQVMADRISEEFLVPRRKAVVYCQMPQAFTDFDVVGYSEGLEKLGFPGAKRTGNQLNDRFGDRVETAILHGPVPVTGSQAALGYPTGGVVDSVLVLRDQPVGIEVAGSPFAGLAILGSMADGVDDGTLGALTDIYLCTGQISQLQTVTPIEGFITDANLEEARRNFPGPDPGDVTADDLNEFIAGTAVRLSEAISKIR